MNWKPEKPPNEAAGAEDERPVSLWNLPNLLSAVRLVGSPLLLPLAWFEQRGAFLALFVLLMLTDWLDGKLAVAWRQRTEFGARLDSAADAAMYAGLLFGGWILLPTFVAEHAAWLLTALASYALTCAAGLLKFGRLPSYHTLGAKASWFLTSVGALIVLAGGPDWMFCAAMVVVTGTNIEATAITLLLPRWQADVLSIYHAWKQRQAIVPAATGLPAATGQRESQPGSATADEDDSNG